MSLSDRHFTSQWSLQGLEFPWGSDSARWEHFSVESSMDTQVTSSHLTTEPHRAAALPVANLFNKASHHPRGEASCCLQLLSRGYKTFCSQSPWGEGGAPACPAAAPQQCTVWGQASHSWFSSPPELCTWRRCWIQTSAHWENIPSSGAHQLELPIHQPVSANPDPWGCYLPA